MMEIGRICIKIAGRDAGGECVIVDILDDKYVLIDGNVRRRRCNIIHLEPSSKKIEIKKNATHEEVKKEFSKLNLPVWDTKKKEKEERPMKSRKKREATDQEEVKKEEKKEKKVRKKEEKKEKKATSEDKKGKAKTDKKKEKNEKIKK